LLHTPLKFLCALAALAALAAATPAAAAPAAQGAPVNFAVLKNDATIFYPTRMLRKGDRFEVNVHHLREFNQLMVVPCQPSCAKPNFVYAYPLQFGIQHLVIPISARYYFWLERDQIGGTGIPIRFGWTRLPLPVLEQQATADHFLAKFDGGTDLSLRTLYVHPLAETAPQADEASSRALILGRPVTY
jgi:hypothetical protein